MTLTLNILLGVLSVVLGIVAIGGDTWAHVGGRARLTTRGVVSLLLLAATLGVGIAKEVVGYREDLLKDQKIDQLTNSQKAPLNFSGLRDMDVGISLSSLLKKYGPADKNLKVVNDSLEYSRWTRDQAELQTLSNGKGEIVAFFVRVNDLEAYTYTSSPISWVLGHSSYLSTVGVNPTFRAEGPDAKLLGYVEGAYFGRWGHYNNFIFSGPFPVEAGLSLDEIDRSTAVPNAVAVFVSADSVGLTKEEWQDTLISIVSVPGTRYEGL